MGIPCTAGMATGTVAQVWVGTGMCYGSGWEQIAKMVYPVPTQSYPALTIW